MPSLITFAAGADSCFKLSSDFSAFTCCMVPRTAFITRTAKITMVLSSFPENMDIIAAPIRITTIRSLNWSKKTWNGLFFLPSLSIFSPASRRIFSACSVLSPCSDVWQAFNASSGDRFHIFFSVIMLHSFFMFSRNLFVPDFVRRLREDIL